jgi:hypothetical protein
VRSGQDRRDGVAAWRAALVLAAAVVVAAAMAGCGLPLGGHGRHAGAASVGGTTQIGVVASPTARLRATVAQAQRTHEIPTPAPADKAPGGWRSPVQAVQVFAQWYVNWTADTVATHLHVLAQVAIGQARSAMTLAAGQVGHDSTIALGGIANSGTVEAIAPVTGERNVYAVVTRERTTATNTKAYQGLRPAWHVTLATVTKVFARLWTISGWQPEN